MRLILRSFLLTLFAVTFSSVNVFSQSATIATDQPDYAPGSTVIITGTGFQPGEIVTLQVLHDPTGGDDATDPSHLPWPVVADASGNVSSTWVVPSDADELGATLKLTADGQSSRLHAEWVFTDAGRSFLSLTVGSQTSNITYGSTSSTTFLVTVNTTGSGNLNGITFSISGLPSGTSFSFLPSSVDASNGLPANQNPTTTLKINANTTSIPAGNYTVTVTASQTQGSNTTTVNGIGTFTIDKAASTTVVTIAAGPFTYTGSPITPATVSVTGAGGLSLTPTADYANNTNAGTATASYSYAGDANHTGSSDSKNFTIGKAASTTVVTIAAGPFTYTGSPITPATVSVTGDGGLNLTPTASYTNNVNAGTATASYTYAGDANHTSSSDSKTFTITKADPTISVTSYDVPYDATAHTATGTAKGVLNEALAGLDLSGTTHTTAGTYTDTWTFTDATGNYNNATSTVTDKISKVDATISVTGFSGVYTGTAHGATGTATGVGSVNLGSLLHVAATTYINVPGGLVHWTFDGDANYNAVSGDAMVTITKANPTITVTGYDVPYDATAHTATGTAKGVLGEALAGLDLSGTTHTTAGTYLDGWSFTDVTGNYTYMSYAVTDKISKVDATISVTGFSGVYTGTAHGATGTATGVGSVNLGSLLHVAATTYINVPGGLVHWTFDGDANYNATSGDATVTITKADATVTVTGYDVPYDATAHTATGTAKGVLNEALAGLDLSGTTHTTAGTYTDTWTFTDATGNYNNATSTVTDKISKVDATISVTGFSGVYTGTAHGATGTATGVGSVNLGSLLHVAATTYINVPGGLVHWTFDGDANYNAVSGDATVTITKADATVTVTGYTGTYDAMTHGAMGSVTGVDAGNSAAGTALNLGASFTNVPGGTANWYLNGGTNYNNQSGTVAIVINKKTASVTPNSTSKFCGQADPGFTGTLSGFIAADGVAATYSRDAGESTGVSYTISATLTPAGILGNYDITYNTSSFTINGISIDASATGNAIQLGTATKTLSAIVTSGVTQVNAASVTFTVTNNVNNIVSTISGTPVTVSTGPNGVATYNLATGSLPAGLYAVTATVGTGCATTIAYFSIYDPNAGFVTGGGWINSPAGAYSPNQSLIGKANFGFNAQYKKGNNTPDGNTEFQFQTGNLNFKSTIYLSGSLVITGGGKAIYKGTGTINGSGTYNFMVSAIDGSIAGSADRFRMKIWDLNGTIVYDNNYGADDNADPSTDATLLGGGSIVIHTPNGKKSREMSPAVTGSAVEVNGNQVTEQTGTGKLTVKVMPNPTSYYFTAGLQSLSKEKVKLVVTDMAGRVIEQRTNVAANSTIQLGGSYHPGIYIAQFMQGTDKVTLRLIKEGN